MHNIKVVHSFIILARYSVCQCCKIKIKLNNFIEINQKFFKLTQVYQGENLGDLHEADCVLY